jgi:hypothetical protein
VAPLVGVVLSYATLFAGMSGAGATAGTALRATPAGRQGAVMDVADVGADVCAAGDAACEAPAAPDAADAIYATPAEVDCRALGLPGAGAAVSRAELDLVAGACSPPVLDFHYRVSRAPESERPSGALRPQHARRARHRDPTCAGLPVDRGTPLSILSVQPMAVYALPALFPPSPARGAFASMTETPSRNLEPLDRPPRA